MTRIQALSGLLALALCAGAGAQETKVYREQGGDKMVVASGGTLEVKSGGKIDCTAATGCVDLAAGEIVAADIGGGAVETAKIATDAVDSTKILTGAVQTNKIGADAVTAEKVLTGAIETAKLATDSVTAAKILAGAVETSKIADGAVDTSKLLGHEGFTTNGALCPLPGGAIGQCTLADASECGCQ